MLNDTERSFMKAIVADKENVIGSNKIIRTFKENPDASWIRNSSLRSNSHIPKSQTISAIDFESKNNIDNQDKLYSTSIKSRSVQNLKQLWTSRIEAKEHVNLNQFNNSNNLSHAKSHSCLLHIKPIANGMTRTTSLQHCTDIKEDPLKSSKDNFYKYKSAANIDKSSKTKASVFTPNFRPEYSLHNQSYLDSSMISATTMNEKVPWSRRSNILALTKSFAQKHLNIHSKVEETMTTPKINVSPIFSDVPSTLSSTTETLHTTPPPTLIICDNSNANNSNHPLDDTNETISSYSLSSPLRTVETSSSRKKNVTSSRKYSFKTQTKSYHPAHKMQFTTSGATNNKVAKLTQQFNEIIQKDKKILDEVKRKNGILIARGGHVYKVIENAEQPKTTTAITSASQINNNTTAITTDDKTDKNDKKDKNDSSVQRAIKNFESKTIEKPKIPLKSIHVLRKKRELSRKESASKRGPKPEFLKEIPEQTKHPPDKCETPKEQTNQTNEVSKSKVHEVIDLIENKKIHTKIDCSSAVRSKTPVAEENVLKKDSTEEDRYTNSNICDESKESHEALKNENINDREEKISNGEYMQSTLEKDTNSQQAPDNYIKIQSERDPPHQTLYEDLYQFVELKDEQFSEINILNALEEVNQRIEILTKRRNTDFGCALNESFLHQPNSDKSHINAVVEAVNTSLINYKDRSLLNSVADTEIDTSFKEEGIYETIAVDPKPSVTPIVSDLKVQPQKSFLFSKTKRNPTTYETINSQNHVSGQDSQSVNESCEAKDLTDDGYEICENTRTIRPCFMSQLKTEHVELQRNTTDKLPELPKPKRIIPKKLFTTVGAVDYRNEFLSNTEDENIYDTIKGVNHCYEILQSSKSKGIDTISLPSNGYESIIHYRRHPRLSNAESSSTISSDHKTNSLYEMSLVNGMFTGGNHSLYLSSDNSDDWIDISDTESNTYDRIEKQQQFIIIRERIKTHRSPDWSRRVRDKRLHQISSDDDDVDHYYEPLAPLLNKNTSPNTIDNVRTSTPKILKCEYNSISQNLSEDYDSFNTDDDIYEDDDLMKKSTSEVDIYNTKLPPTPPSKNQVYAFVKKFKNFISNKKSPSDPNKCFADTIQAKMYENTQFQREHNEYQSTLKPTRRAPDKPKTPKTRSKKNIGSAIGEASIVNDNNVYENTDFHNTKQKVSSPVKSENTTTHLSTSEKNLIAANDTANRQKSKSGRSFKSRLRSLGASNSESKSTSTLATARSTFYISDSTASEQDSGIFIKTSSGNLSSVKPENVETSNKETDFVRKIKKDSNTSSSYRRRTTIGIRPNDPPPPPPLMSEDSRKQKTRSSTTSWYAECGVFKVDSTATVDNESLEHKVPNLKKSSSGTSWYAEAGLYQTSGISVASSSGSSGVSTGNEGGIGDDITHHIFPNEPLYQIYNAEKLISLSRDMEDRESTDGYEEVGVIAHIAETENTKRSRPTALQLVGPKTGPSRTLWSEISEVVASEILSTLTPRERSLQEAKFEIITSEASYLKSLNLLRTHFVNNAIFHDSSILSTHDQRALFSYIAPVHECSEKLLSELENCWQDNIMLLGLSKSIYTSAEKHFHVYISYCEHQGKMDRTLRRLKEAKSVFCQKLEVLESDPICCGLTLHSFLMLPMQRITRLPLLIDAVFSKVHPNDDEYESWKLTLSILNKIVAQCNDAANRCEQAYEIERISRQLEFPSHIRSLAIAPIGVAVTGAKPRFLVKKGELIYLVWRGDDAKLTFGKKFSKSSIYAFLFSDLMVLTKKKGEDQYMVFDYCPRNLLTISSGDSIPQLPTKDANQSGKNFILMTLLENHEKKTVELLLSCPSVSEMERWLQATRPPEAETPGEKLYEQWDCPQVIAKHEYIANEPDLLSLEIGDVVNVSRKLPDGWFNGERIRDGAIGWFPGSFTEEVNSAHVRARNLKQRYRLLTFTATYLEMQKKK